MLEGAVLTIGDEALRPGEIFALHRPELDFEKNLIHVKRQIALETGKITWPKDFYDLKHRAIQWMVNPVEEGGLGLDSATVAEVVGYDDGGYPHRDRLHKARPAPRHRTSTARNGRLPTTQRRRRAEPPRLTVVRDAA